MTAVDTARLLYLSLLGVMVGTYFFAYSRQTISKSLQQALAWIGIFTLFVIAYGERDVFLAELFPRSARQLDGQTIALSRSLSGSFEAMLEVNGVPVLFLLDTGATDVVLSQKDARRVGLDMDGLVYSGRASTANGIVRTAPVLLDSIAFKDFEDRRIAASVNSGSLDVSLLGMSYLDRYNRIEIRGNQMQLVR